MTMQTTNKEIEKAIEIMTDGVNEICAFCRREQDSCSPDIFLFLDESIERAVNRLDTLSALLRNGSITYAAAQKLFSEPL
jgi:hypothetical protein